ncbi:hypothetical protein MG293_015343 [Ovis ammon polii]|uniref:KASH domain-containing protein n=1 Tax=Ovis ammon polii TaxID=230172 RepID=A0AAD4TU30_OVIAM|nr:hypothetical protein MG293_015343 [Ovis ammon polii]
MARPPPLGPRSPSEPFSHPPGAPRELDATGDTICIASGEESIRSEQAQKLGQDSLDPPEHFQGGPRGLEPVADLPRLPAPSSLEESAGAKNLEDLERGLGPCVSAQSRMVQLQALQADLRGAAERLDALLVFGEGLAQRSEPQTRAALEQLLKAFRAHQDSIFRQLWRLQAQLVSTSLDMLMSGLSHRKHIASHRRQPLLWKSRDRMRQASPSLQDVMLEAHPGVPTPSSRRPLTFFHLLLLFLFLVGITLFLPTSGGSCCSPAQLIRTPYLELSYVNGPPPM